MLGEVEIFLETAVDTILGEIAPEETRPVMTYPKNVHPKDCRVRYLHC